MKNHFANKSNEQMVDALNNAEALVPTTWDGRNAQHNRINAIIAELSKRGALIVKHHIKRHRNGSRRRLHR